MKHAQIFVNLPVKDLKRSVEFFTKLGCTFNPQFTDENATCMIIGENLFVMLLVEKFFGTFTHKGITDTTRKQTQVSIHTLLAESDDRGVRYNDCARLFQSTLSSRRVTRHS